MAAIFAVGLGVALFLIVAGVSVTSQLQGDGAAINEAGKLRMQTYRIGFRLRKAAAANPGKRAELWQKIRADIRTYDQRLRHQRQYIEQGFPAYLSLPRQARPTLEEIITDWRRRKARLPLESEDLDAGDVATYQQGLGDYVGQINRYVGLLQQSTATKLKRYHLSLLGFSLLVGIVAVVSHQRTRHYLTRPLQSLHDCAKRIAAGDLTNCRAPRADTEEMDQLARVFNHMGDELADYKRNMDARVAEQTHSLQQRNQRLAMLYEVAVNLQANRSVEELLSQALTQVVSVTGAAGGIVRLTTADGYLQMVDSLGLAPGAWPGESKVPMDRCLCGQSALDGELGWQQDLTYCGKQLNNTLPCGQQAGMFAVPITHRQEVLGLFTLFAPPEQEGIQSLLETVASHVGLAIENRRLITEAQRASLMEERQLLASELHDAIAQNLASAKLRLGLVPEAMASDPGRAGELVQEARHGVETGYSNLRELLTHFRTRIDERGLLPAVRDLTADFQERTAIHVYFQVETDQLELEPEQEVQAFHIVQEGLTNIEKHARAEHARLLIRTDDGYAHFLVEDDGVGLTSGNPVQPENAHFGLAIMRERAERLGGELELDSEPGEGMRLSLRFPLHKQEPLPAASKESA